MVRFGIFLLIIGGGSFILPHIGVQFIIIDIFGKYAPWVGGGAAILGIVLILAGVSSGKKKPDE